VSKRLRDYVLTAVHCISTFAKKMAKVNKDNTSYYKKAWNLYEESLFSNINITVQEFCKEHDINARSMLRWGCENFQSTARSRQKVMDRLKALAEGKSALEGGGTAVSPETGLCVRYRVRERLDELDDRLLHGVEIIFPDEVHLSLVEASAESVSKLLVMYNNRR